MWSHQSIGLVGGGDLYVFKTVVTLLAGGFVECATRAGQELSSCITPQQQICFLCVCV